MDAVDALGAAAALEQAKKSYAEGGIPIGAALVQHGSAGSAPKLIACGHNERIQKSSATLHGEISCLENAGRLKADVYRNCTMVSFAFSYEPNVCIMHSSLHSSLHSGTFQAL